MIIVRDQSARLSLGMVASPQSLFRFTWQWKYRLCDLLPWGSRRCFFAANEVWPPNAVRPS